MTAESRAEARAKAIATRKQNIEKRKTAEAEKAKSAGAA